MPISLDYSYKTALDNFMKLTNKILSSKFAFSALGFGVVALFGIASVALAQVSGSSGPVQVTANEIDVRPSENMAIFSGNAEVVQDGTVLRSRQLKVFYAPEGSADSGKIQRVVSDTEVFFTTPTERVRGNRAEFNANSNVVTFVGNVILAQGQNVVTGEELRINTQTRASTMKSSGGRVKAVFFPNNQPK